ncbi:MAG: reverse transcriptase/maturase family protein [Eubacteriales bacterium]|nr:reverse transcriptase/maturase family protein [Eubacteriales bacterium]
MIVQEWIDDPKTLEKSRKSYAHFDNRTDIKKMINFIRKPENIAHYGFFPFIHYVQKATKYNGEKGKNVKERDICYAAHLDRCIYQYYCFLLNERYNQKLKEKEIDRVSVAYRTNLHASNIQSACRAFDFIRKNPKSYVMIGDFTGFFDSLDHQYLKKQWCDLLGVEILPDDHYAVYKNISKYSKWELTDLLKLNGLSDTYAGRNELNKKKTVLTKEQYRNNREQIVKNNLPYGIPQGSPISAVLANIYMLEADYMINEKVKQYSGLYMRYSDDFIIVLPDGEMDEKTFFQEIREIINYIPNLQLENSKTQIFRVEIPEVKNVGKVFMHDADVSKKLINFLGFSFDGNKISIRPKTISKYYYRMNRKAKSIAKNPNFLGCDNLYMRYSERGAAGYCGNFFTYVNNAEKEFGTNELIRHDLKKHMSKIRKALKKGA